VMRFACVCFERDGLLLYAACARRQLGNLLGAVSGAREIAQADAFMAEQGISNPERWTAMFAPLPELPVS